MMFFDDTAFPIILESLYQPLATTHYWVYSLDMMDLTLHPLTVLEEITCTALEVQINGSALVVPANWGILIYDTETTQVDAIELSNTIGQSFGALVGSMVDSSAHEAQITITNYFPSIPIITPSMSKSMLLCHPISNTEFVILCSSIPHTKYLKNLILSDII
jgi:hypothetical protein